MTVQPQLQAPPQPHPPPNEDATRESPKSSSTPLPPPIRANTVSVRFTCSDAPQTVHVWGSFSAAMLRSASNLVWQALQ